MAPYLPSAAIKSTLSAEKYSWLDEQYGRVNTPFKLVPLARAFNPSLARHFLSSLLTLIAPVGIDIPAEQLPIDVNFPVGDNENNSHS